ncbi:MAG: M1 family aminopeptidase [Blastocatellia bacterium]
MNFLEQKKNWELCTLVVFCLMVESVFANDGAHLRNGSTMRYQLEIDLDFRGASFTGRQRIGFSNSSREEVESLFFTLYPNVGYAEEEGPWLSVQDVSLWGRTLRYSMRGRNTVLKVDLPQKLAPGQRIELKFDFTGRLPKIQREESSLLAHFLQEVNDAVSDERQQKDARDIFFASEEAILMGYFHPMLAPRQQQSVEQNVAIGLGAIVACDAADYEVSVTTDDGVTVISSGAAIESKPVGGAARKRVLHRFRGQNLRGFGMALAERVRSATQQVGDVRVTSYFRESDERVGKRALGMAANAIQSYSRAFGDYPQKQLQLIEMPLPAPYSGIEFPALVVMAQAYFIDFDSPQSARLPGVLREQSDVIRSAFEFTLAHGVAKQWWGHTVGSEPERAPYLDESLATFAAAYYHEAVYGPDLGDKIIDQQIRGVYQAYRMLGGPDLEAEKPAKEFRNALQYTAIVQVKSALLLVALRKELGDERFFNALRKYYAAHRFHTATPEHFRLAFFDAADDPRPVRALFQRWLKEKHGDEDIGAPDLTLAPPPVSKIRRLGRVFVKIGRTAAKRLNERVSVARP